MRLRRAFPAIVLASVACGEAAAGPDVVVGDSAGVAVVENLPEALASAPRWIVVAEPSLELRSREGERVILFQVRDVRPLDDGRIAVVNAGSSEALVFARDGSLLQRLGRAGDGPGEFRAPATLVPLGDSVGVYDAQRRRLSVFSPEGGLAREAAFDTDIGSERYLEARTLPGREVVLLSTGGLPTEMGVSRAEARFLRFGVDGTPLARYPVLPGHQLYRSAQLAGPLLFGAITVATTAGADLVVGLGDAPELRFFGPDGALRRIVRWPDGGRSVTAERVQRFLEAGLAELPEAQRPTMRQMFEQLPRAERLPPYEDLLSTDEGEVWVGSYLGPERAVPGFRQPAREWLVFDSTGALIATLETPEGFLPASAHADELLGVFTDAERVESVRVYRIMRGRS